MIGTFLSPKLTSLGGNYLNYAATAALSGGAILYLKFRVRETKKERRKKEEGEEKEKQEKEKEEGEEATGRASKMEHQVGEGVTQWLKNHTKMRNSLPYSYMGIYACSTTTVGAGLPHCTLSFRPNAPRLRRTSSRRT